MRVLPVLFIISPYRAYYKKHSNVPTTGFCVLLIQKKHSRPSRVSFLPPPCPPTGALRAGRVYFVVSLEFSVCPSFVRGFRPCPPRLRSGCWWLVLFPLLLRCVLVVHCPAPLERVRACGATPRWLASPSPCPLGFAQGQATASP